MRCVRATLALGLAALPLTLVAQNGLNELARNMRTLDKNFDAADKNHDGLLTRQEAQATPFIARNFDAIDAKRRGAVSKQDVRDYIAHALKRTSQKNVPATAASSPTSHP
jgi:Ca2+-binding EF-hand superfamily protein